MKKLLFIMFSFFTLSCNVINETPDGKTHLENQSGLDKSLAEIIGKEFGELFYFVINESYNDPRDIELSEKISYYGNTYLTYYYPNISYFNISIGDDENHEPFSDAQDTFLSAMVEELETGDDIDFETYIDKWTNNVSTLPEEDQFCTSVLLSIVRNTNNVAYEMSHNSPNLLTRGNPIKDITVEYIICAGVNHGVGRIWGIFAGGITTGITGNPVIGGGVGELVSWGSSLLLTWYICGTSKEGSGGDPDDQTGDDWEEDDPEETIAGDGDSDSEEEGPRNEP